MKHRLVLLGLIALTSGASAQSSQFGVRGLGIPLRPLSVRSTGTGGGFGLFDQESALNPAAIGSVGNLFASFQTAQSWRRSESPVGAGTVRDNRFPGIFIAGPVGGTPLSVAVSASGYTDRNFSLASHDTIILRDVPVGVFDTLSSEGGISDLRVAGAWRASRALVLGLGLHMLTGSNRIRSQRNFSDSAYAGATERSTISYLGVGVSVGAMVRLGPTLSLAAMVRADDRMRVQHDTIGVGSTKLPLTLSGGARFQVGERFRFAAGALYRNWSVADADLIEQGGVGSSNTAEFSGGVEILTNVRRPDHRPIRLGIYHARLPFPLRKGEDADEAGISIGSSLRFVQDRAGFDFALSHIWRKGAPGFTERVLLLTLGVTVRP